MISLPDFKEKQLLFIQAEWGVKTYLHILNDNIVYKKDGNVVNRVSLHKAFAIFIVGDLSISTQFIKKCTEHGISIYFLKHNLETYSASQVVAEGHTFLRMRQYDMSRIEELNIAREIIKNKIRNQARILIQKKKDLKDLYRNHRKISLDTLNIAEDSNSILGIEGNFSKLYFSQLFKEFEWVRRAPRTKEDINNLLMDIGYTYLFNLVDSILRLHGFDTYKGVYHKLFFHRKSLSCDLMEPFRPLIDAKIYSMWNLGQIDPKDFGFKDGAYELKYTFQKKYTSLFLEELMKNKEEIFRYLHSYYLHVVKPDNYLMPKFTIK
jgi:CRISPR-associated protein Cas1